MKVLVVTAHPDDLEIGCAGTLRKLQNQGAEIISVITIKPSNEINQQRNQSTVTTELVKSYSLSKFELRVLDTNLHANGRPNLVFDNNTMTQLGELLEPCDIAILPNPQDYHQDHKNTYYLAFPLVKQLAQEVWIMDSWPYCHYYKENNSNLHYNISEYWNFKQELLECYSSYLSPNKIEQIKIDNQWRGQKAGFDMAESYSIVSRYVR